MPEIGTLFLLGILNGAALCTLSCLQYMSPFLLCTGGGFKDGVLMSFHYLIGKIIIYAALSAGAGYLGKIFAENLKSSGKYGMGITMIALAVAFPFISSEKKCSASAFKRNKKLTMFMMGISTSVLPCPAVIGLLLVSAEKGSVFYGFLFGLAYGLGLMISPLLPAAGGLAVISKSMKVEVKSFMPYLKGLSMIIILIMGVRVLMI
ncbi:MAG: sulfite exporter TauE/SafE family protein [Spirochaetia bacterium]|nr:sulfite exporter TauE/SafE family protein [Spirochaetia bacterium]